MIMLLFSSPPFGSVGLPLLDFNIHLPTEHSRAVFTEIKAHPTPPLLQRQQLLLCQPHPWVSSVVESLIS
jgi:hypothetical protein